MSDNLRPRYYADRLYPLSANARQDALKDVPEQWRDWVMGYVEGRDWFVAYYVGRVMRETSRARRRMALEATPAAIRANVEAEVRRMFTGDKT